MNRPVGHRLVALLAVAVVALGALGSCGIPDDDAPRAVAADEIPDALVAAPTTTTAPQGGVGTNLFFIEAERGRSVLSAQRVPLDNQQARTVLEALVGTVPEDLPDGVNSSIPAETRVLGTSLDDGILTIDLSEEFATVSGDILIQAVGQLVFTATERPGVDGVLFTIEGEPTTVPDAESSELTTPATRSDYAALLPSADG